MKVEVNSWEMINNSNVFKKRIFFKNMFFNQDFL